MSDLTANNLSMEYKTGFLIILLGNFENVTQCSFEQFELICLIEKVFFF